MEPSVRFLAISEVQLRNLCLLLFTGGVVVRVLCMVEDHQPPWLQLEDRVVPRAPCTSLDWFDVGRGASESRVRFARARVASLAASASRTTRTVLVHVSIGGESPREAPQCCSTVSRYASHTRATCAWVASASVCRCASCASSASYSASSSAVLTHRMGTAMPLPPPPSSPGFTNMATSVSRMGHIGGEPLRECRQLVWIGSPC